MFKTLLRCCAVSLLLCPLLFYSGSAQARDYTYLGLGFSHVSINSDSPVIGGARGAGVLLLFGRTFAETWAFELMLTGDGGLDVGPTQDIFYPADSADYGAVAIGLRKSLWSLDERRWAPWLTLGVGYVTVLWNTFAYDLSGDSFYYGLGTDLLLTDRLLLRLQWDQQHFSAGDMYGHLSSSTRVPQVAAALVFRW